MNDRHSLWQVFVDELQACLLMYCEPLIVTWRWLRRIWRR
jgi:hypothetical protein